MQIIREMIVVFWNYMISHARTNYDATLIFEVVVGFRMAWEQQRRRNDDLKL